MVFPPLKGGRSQVRAKLVLVTLRNQAGALGQAAAGRSGGKPDFLMGEQLVPLFWWEKIIHYRDRIKWFTSKNGYPQVMASLRGNMIVNNEILVFWDKPKWDYLTAKWDISTGKPYPCLRVANLSFHHQKVMLVMSFWRACPQISTIFV